MKYASFSRRLSCLLCSIYQDLIWILLIAQPEKWRHDLPEMSSEAIRLVLENSWDVDRPALWEWTSVPPVTMTP
jgi:hypothetical protein